MSQYFEIVYFQLCIIFLASSFTQDILSPLSHINVSIYIKDEL